MTPRTCLCGTAADICERSEARADGASDTFYWVACPVCGQIGPRIAAAGRGRDTVVAEAIAAWDAMLARARPLEA